MRPWQALVSGLEMELVMRCHELIELAACSKQTVQNLLPSPAGWNLMRHSESSAAVLAMFWGGTGAGANCVI